MNCKRSDSFHERPKCSEETSAPSPQLTALPSRSALLQVGATHLKLRFHCWEESFRHQRHSKNIDVPSSAILTTFTCPITFRRMHLLPQALQCRPAHVPGASAEGTRPGSHAQHLPSSGDWSRLAPTRHFEWWSHCIRYTRCFAGQTRIATSLFQLHRLSRLRARCVHSSDEKSAPAEHNKQPPRE